MEQFNQQHVTYNRYANNFAIHINTTHIDVGQEQLDFNCDKYDLPSMFKICVHTFLALSIPEFYCFIVTAWCY